MISSILNAIQEAEAHGTLSPEAVRPVLTGLSGDKLVGTLQRLAKLFSTEPDTCYAEIGVFQGLTLLSVAAAVPEIPCYGIDNFSDHDPEGRNQAIFEERQSKISAENAYLINEDLESALHNFKERSGGRKIGVLFVDGPHDYRSQIICLLFAKGALHDNAVIIVDDSNYQHVRMANRDFLLSHPDYKLVFEAYTARHPIHMDSQEEAAARAGWWDGVNIMVRDHDNVLEPILPSDEPKSMCFVNDHIVHAHRYGELAPHAIQFLVGLEQPARFPRTLFGLMKRFRKFRDGRHAESLATNTFSGGLTAGRYASLRSK